MNKLFWFLIVWLLLAIWGVIYSNYNHQFGNLLCKKINFCNHSMIDQSIDQKSIFSWEINKHDDAITPINWYNPIDQNVFQRITDDEIDTYGKITWSEISYPWKQIATIQWNKIRYKNISIMLPLDMIWWNHRFSVNSWSIKNELFWLIDKVRFIQWTYNIDKSMAFIIYNDTQNIDIKEFCDDQNLPWAWNRVADSISKEITTEDWIDIYKIYRTYNESQQESNWELCTIRHDILYKIFVYNYNQENTKEILDSFQFIE